MTRRGHRRILSRQRSQRRQLAARDRAEENRTTDERGADTAPEAEAA